MELQQAPTAEELEKRPNSALISWILGVFCLAISVLYISNERSHSRQLNDKDKMIDNYIKINKEQGVLLEKRNSQLIEVIRLNNLQDSLR